MEGKERDILDRNRELLVRNIILTSEFYELLQTYSVLPSTMVTDVMSARTREEKNTRLLETVRLRGCDSFRKLRHVLSLTGHAFLADHLYEEETDTKILRSEDFFGKFPNIFNHISDDGKSKLFRYLETKMKEKMLVNAWVSSPLERRDILESRKMGFEHDKDLRKRLEKYRQQVIQLSDELVSAKEELMQNHVEMKIHTREREEAEKRYKQELGVQSRFNAANNNSVLRLKEQFVSINNKIQDINTWLHRYLGETSTVESNETTVISAKLTILENNIQKLMDRADLHADTLDRSSSEKETILNLLKKPLSKTESIFAVIRKHIEKENKLKLEIRREMDKLFETLHEIGNLTGSHGKGSGISGDSTDLRVVRNGIATFRAEAEHLGKKLTWKDNQISDLIEEIGNLRQKMAHTTVLRPIERRTRVGTKERSLTPGNSPEDTLETRFTYEQPDDKLPQSVNPPPPKVEKLSNHIENPDRYSCYVLSSSSDGCTVNSEGTHVSSKQCLKRTENDTNVCRTSRVSFAKQNMVKEDIHPSMSGIQHSNDVSQTRKHASDLIRPSHPRIPHGRTSSPHQGNSSDSNTERRERDLNTMALQEVTSYMEEKTAEGKLPPILPFSF